MTKRLSLLMSTYITKIRAIISVEAIYLEKIEINGKIHPREIDLGTIIPSINAYVIHHDRMNLLILPLIEQAHF